MAVSRALNIISREKASVKKVNDKVIFALARRSSASIYTYDKELKRKPKDHG